MVLGRSKAIIHRAGPLVETTARLAGNVMEEVAGEAITTFSVQAAHHGGADTTMIGLRWTPVTEVAIGTATTDAARGRQ